MHGQANISDLKKETNIPYFIAYPAPPPKNFKLKNWVPDL
jgi:hypothetical protein